MSEEPVDVPETPDEPEYQRVLGSPMVIAKVRCPVCESHHEVLLDPEALP